MPRNMSFAETTEQILARTKTVTRRKGWKNLQTGDRLWAVRKAMGLKKGEKVERLALIEVVDVRIEMLTDITGDDVTAEGFPGMSPDEFVDFYCSVNGGPRIQECTRIEFRYVDAGVAVHVDSAPNIVVNVDHRPDDSAAAAALAYKLRTAEAEARRSFVGTCRRRP